MKIKRKLKLHHYINYIVIGVMTLLLSIITFTGGHFDNSLLFLLEKVAIVTLAFGEIVKSLFQNSSDSSFGGSLGLETSRFDKNYLFIIAFILVLLTLAVTQNLIRSKHGRALMCHPKLLMLDEPSMGLSPLLVDQVFDLIKDINKGGTTVLLVEQNAGKSLAISDRAYVMETGKIVLSGTGAELAASEMVRKAYLGG